MSRVLTLSLIAFACFASVRAQTRQPIVPFLDEVIINSTSGRATAYFGYSNPNANAVTLNVGDPVNYFFPSPQNRGQTTRFVPGTHHYAFASLFLYADEPTLTWIVDGSAATLIHL